MGVALNVVFCFQSFGRFNPVTLYMRTGAQDERMLPDPPPMCSLDPNGQSPDHSVQGNPHSQLGSTPMVLSSADRQMIVHRR